MFERDAADFETLKVCVGQRNGAANADREVAGSAEVEASCPDTRRQDVQSSTIAGASRVFETLCRMKKSAAAGDEIRDGAACSEGN